MRKTTTSRDGHAASLAAVVWRHPRETLGGLTALAAVATIFANALFMQKGPHPAPIFAPRTVAQAPAAVRAETPLPPAPRPLNAVAIRPASFEPAQPQQAAVKAVRHDPIGELIASPPKRLVAIQRALSEFGYGQLKANGQMGADTEQAIAKFERENRMPVTGQVSDRLVKALATMTGRSFD